MCDLGKAIYQYFDDQKYSSINGWGKCAIPGGETSYWQNSVPLFTIETVVGTAATSVSVHDVVPGTVVDHVAIVAHSPNDNGAKIVVTDVEDWNDFIRKIPAKIDLVESAPIQTDYERVLEWVKSAPYIDHNGDGWTFVPARSGCKGIVLDNHTLPLWLEYHLDSKPMYRVECITEEDVCVFIYDGESRVGIVLEQWFKWIARPEWQHTKPTPPATKEYLPGNSKYGVFASDESGNLWGLLCPVDGDDSWVLINQPSVQG
jgi:hypothetical protein